MAVWRHPLRFGLALLVVGVGVAVFVNLRERAEPVQAVMVERTDADAIIETRGSEIVQADVLGDNMRVVAGSQMTYAGGGLRMADGVEVTVEAREGRDGFVLRSASASVDAGETELSLSGDVRLVAGGGLEASTESAQYSDADGVVRMPDAATFVRGNMRATAARAVYDRKSDLLLLSSSASVTLDGSGETPTAIKADSATVAQRDGLMTFGGGASIDAGDLHMTATRVRADLVPDTSQIESIMLREDARITGTVAGAGQLRGLNAGIIELRYDKNGSAVERAILSGGATLALFGADSDAGAGIAAAAMEIDFGDGGAIDSVAAREDVALELPAAGAAAGQRIEADTLDVEGLSGDGQEQARFEGGVEYREQRAAAGATRVARAEQLEATLAGGLSLLEEATFRGGVLFEDGDVTGQGDEARYLIADDAIELVAAEEDGDSPRVVYDRGSVNAASMRIGFAGPQIGGQGAVESVLSNSADGTADAAYPGLVNDVEPLLLTAGMLAYDGAEQLAMYTGGAHLWQGDTTFRGESLVLDEATGNLLLDGAVQTRFMMNRTNSETEMKEVDAEAEESAATANAEVMRYEQDLHRATFTGGAHLDGPQGDLQADRIQVQLLPDHVTLEVVTATGNVTLLTPGRIVTGDKLVYRDADGSYEMEGEPVRFVEAMEDGCRETLGRTLAFFASVDDVSVDGQNQRRTATASGDCPAELIDSP